MKGRRPAVWSTAVLLTGVITAELKRYLITFGHLRALVMVMLCTLIFSVMQSNLWDGTD